MKIDFDKLVHFTEKQKEATRLALKYNYFLYGGAAGGGKSYWLRWFSILFLYYCYWKYGLENVRAGLFCEDYPSLWDRQVSKIKYEFPPELGTFNQQQHEFQLALGLGGGILCFRNLDDPKKYLSAEFALEAVDELTRDEKEIFDFLRLRKRWPGLPITKFIAGTNPGGIGHAWVKDLWINGKFDPNEKEKEQFKFLKATVFDNKENITDDYIKILDSLPEKMRKAYKEGNWDIFEGQYFPEWDVERHTLSPFPIPEYWRKFRAYDHGRENPACCLWGALDEDGRVWIYREYYSTGQNVDQIAEEINRLSQGENYTWSVADPSIFAKQGMVDKFGGETIAQNFARHKIQFIPASNRRIDGWNLVHQYLYWDDLKQPKVKIFNTCHNLIRTLPSLIHDDIKPEDVDTECEDHAPDALRYLLMSLKENKSERSKTDTERRLEEIKNSNSAYNFNQFYQ